MPTRARFWWWTRALPVAALAATVPAGAQTHADTVALRRVVHDRLADARALTLTVRSPDERERLLGAVLGAQLTADDLDGAVTTARAVGHDRGGALTRVMCALVAARRVDDADAVARLITTALDRDWALARLAVQRGGRLLGEPDTAAALRQASVIARAITSPLPRADALLAIAERQLQARDTTGATATVDAAHAVVRGVADADLRGQRLALLAGLLARTGRVDEGLRLSRALRHPEDRLEAVLAVARSGAGARVPTVHAAVVALARDSVRIVDVRARDAFLARVADGFAAQNDSVTARRLGRGSRWATIRPTLADSARELAHRGDHDGAVRMVARIADPDRLGLQARAYRQIAGAIHPTHQVEPARRYLRLARTAALRGAGAEFRDELLADVARVQFWLVDNDGALETLHDVRSPQLVIGAAYDLAMSTFNRADYAEQRRIARALPHADARDAIMAQTIARHLEGDARRRALDLSQERARADSIATPRHRATALAALADAHVVRGDSAGALALWRSLLLASGSDATRGDAAAVEGLVRLGDTATVVTWVAARPVRAARARATLVHAGALQRQLDRATNRMRVFSNAPDGCREMF